VGKKSNKARSTSTPLARFFKRAIVVFLCVFGVASVWIVGFMMANIRNVEGLVDQVGEKIQVHNSKPSRIYSADNKILYEIQPVYKENVSLASVPQHMVKAILAAEDKRYYEHKGVDFWGLARASVNLVKAGRIDGGGSTITMQLAKRLFSASEKKMQRKVQDISIAFQLEKKYTKDQILELYLNQVYFGEQAYGLAAAAQIYFGKKVEDLDLAESAMLARCVRIPAVENPVKNYQTANTNKNVVLAVMLEEKWITKEEHDRAVEETPKVLKTSAVKGGRVYRAGAFVRVVLNELRSRDIDLSAGGYSVNTTLDWEVQQQAEDSVERMVRENRRLGVNTGAFLAIDSEGRIIADVGGFNRKNQYSRTHQSKMQPGSSFKSFIYAEALKEGIVGEYSEISNAKLKLPGRSRREPYTPRNSHGGYGGSYSLFSAFAQSMNVPAVRTFWTLGPKKGVPLIKSDFGITSKIPEVASVALGSAEVSMVEMARGYSVFMLDGRRVEPFRVKDVIGPNGEILYENQPTFSTTRIGPDICNIMDRLLRGVVTSGTGRPASFLNEARGKTGTTDEGKDLWFCGYSKGIVGIAWAGNEYLDTKRNRWLQRAMPSGFGGEVSAPMWANAMRPAVEKFGSDVKPDFRANPEELNRESAEERAERRRKRKEERERAQEQDRVIIRDEGVDDPTNSEQPPVTINSDDPTRQPEIPEPIKRPDTRRNDPPVENDDKEVSVEVCADSGQIATRYCPETITRKFTKSKRPRGRCRVHKAPDEGTTGGGTL
jgi:penicillin-binding protein 1A